MYIGTYNGTLISFNIQTLNFDKNLPLQISFIKFDLAKTFKNLLNMAVLGEYLNKTDMEKVC